MTSENRITLVHREAIIVICVLLTVFLLSPTNVQGLESSYSNLSTGPYVDEVIFRVIVNQDQRILALQAGEIEMDTSFFDPVYIPIINADPAISVHQGIRNGYGHLTINCDKYPLNISGLRRAFAYAFDKTKATEVVLDGFGIEHDSLVPLPNGWCVEDEFDWHYYTNQSDIGNQILDDLNFTIDSGTGFRLAPNGSPFEVIIEYAAPGAYEVPSIAVEAFDSLHIEADEQSSDFNEYIARLDNHGDYDMVFYAINFYENDIDWLAYEYWSEYADVDYQNPTNFKNDTYDSWRDQLLYGTTYEEVHEAAAEMQKILHYNVPRLVVYENMYLQAYRNDVFTNHVEDLGKHISGPWTLRNIHKLDGTSGGSVPVAIAQEPDTFNIFTTRSAYSEAILSELWPSLYKYGPDLKPYPDLAESMITETHSDNPEVPEGHTRFTIDTIRNATWSDGTPVTAEDVAFTFVYGLETGNYTDMHDKDLSDIESIYCPNTFRVILEFTTESYWHFSKFAYNYIIPQHIFNEATGIGYDAWNTWNPVFDPAEPNVNCGPFVFTDYEAGEFYKIERNPLFHYAIDPSDSITDPTSVPTSTIVSTITTGNTNDSTEQEMNWSLVFSYAIGSSSTIVILVCLVIIIQNRKNMENT